MKKHFSLCLLLFNLIVITHSSCTNILEDTSHDGNVAPSQENTELRTIEEVVSIANQAPDLFSNKTRDISTNQKELDLTSITTIKSNITRSNENTFNNSPIIYAINYKNDNGYVLVSSKKNSPGIIGYVEEGSYDTKELQNKNTNIGYVVDNATKYLVNQERPNLDYIKTNDTIKSSAGPYIQTKWGQNNPEGIFCPNKIAGCANTAMAQIMAYYEYPDTILLTYQDADKNFQVLNWKEMKKHTITHSITNPKLQLYCPASEEAHYAIGRLCRQLGEMNLSDYWNDHVEGTGTLENDMWNTARVLGYDVKKWKEYNDSILLKPLLERHPVIVSGVKLNNSGHMWIVDGYIKLIITTVDPIKTDGQIIKTTRKEIYNHVNWGWDGRNNGYFLSNIFDAKQVYKPDSSPHGTITGEGDYNYCHELKFFEFSKVNSSPIFPLSNVENK